MNTTISFRDFIETKYGKISPSHPVHLDWEEILNSQREYAALQPKQEANPIESVNPRTGKTMVLKADKTGFEEKQEAKDTERYREAVRLATELDEGLNWEDTEDNNADGWKDAVNLLLELSQLKKYKDAIGKDDFYNKRQPELWKEVNDFLDTIKAQGI